VADHPIEEFLPLHIVFIAARQLCKVFDHQTRQLASIHKPKILPKVLASRGSAGDKNGQQ
jgi:hypothetical protein